MTSNSLSAGGIGIVYVEVAEADLLLFNMQINEIGKDLLESLIRYSVTDLLTLLKLRPHIILRNSNSERIILTTNTAYEAILIAREIMNFRHIRPISVGQNVLRYKIGVHYSEEMIHTQFSTDHEDVSLAKNCARLAAPNEIVCSEQVMEFVKADSKMEKEILDEFNPFPKTPGRASWSFREEFRSRRHSFEHSYFLSYSHEDIVTADHVELLLLRHGRKVRRDEKFLEPTIPMDEHFLQQIKCCDTFIALYNTNYKNSGNCQGELSEARVCWRATRTCPRIVFIRLDGEQPHLEDATHLYYPASSRSEMENVISKLIAKERH